MGKNRQFKFKEVKLWKTIILVIFTACVIVGYVELQKSLTEEDINPPIDSVSNLSDNNIEQNKEKQEVPPEFFEYKFKFEDYPVEEIYAGKLAPVDLYSHPDAMEYRTRLKEDTATNGVNFAGHYSIVEIGCGTECEIIFIVDAIDGKIYKPKFIAEWGVNFKKDSYLLVENPPETVEELYQSRGRLTDYISTQ